MLKAAKGVVVADPPKVAKTPEADAKEAAKTASDNKVASGGGKPDLAPAEGVKDPDADD